MVPKSALLDRLTESASAAPGSSVEAATRALELASRGHGGSRSAFLTRAINALTHLARESDADVLGDAAGAESDYGVLLRALSFPSALSTLRDVDPLVPAKLRGLAARERLLEAEGGTVPATNVARLLGITRQAVDKRRRNGKLIGVSLGRRGYAYPVWQFDTSGTLAGLEETLTDLDSEDPWTRLDFLLGPNDRLEGATPLTLLRAGRIAEVREAARLYGEQGGI